MEVSGQLHVPAALPPEKKPWYPLDRRLGGAQSRSGRGGEEKYRGMLILTWGTGFYVRKGIRSSVERVSYYCFECTCTN
jgi:hypothetical protein